MADHDRASLGRAADFLRSLLGVVTGFLHLLLGGFVFVGLFLRCRERGGEQRG